MTSTLSEWQQPRFQDIYVLALHTTAFTQGANLHGVTSCNLAVDTSFKMQKTTVDHSWRASFQFERKKRLKKKALSSFTSQRRAGKTKWERWQAVEWWKDVLYIHVYLCKRKWSKCRSPSLHKSEQQLECFAFNLLWMLPTCSWGHF